MNKQKKELKDLREVLIKAFENSPHKIVHDPEVEGGTLFVLSVDYPKLVDLVMPAIEQTLDQNTNEILKRIEKESGQFTHSDFCYKDGAQFKKCLICILDSIKEEYK